MYKRLYRIRSSDLDLIFIIHLPKTFLRDYVSFKDPLSNLWYYLTLRRYYIKISLTVYFVRNLEKEVTVIEGKSVDISCELSKEDAAVKWLKYGSPIQFSGNRFIKDENGRVYQLIIRDSNMEADGVYTMQVEGKSSQELKLKVICK